MRNSLLRSFSVYASHFLVAASLLGPARIAWGQDSTAVDRRFEATAAMLTRFIEHEMHDKRLPGLSIALVDDQQIVWARGFGWAKPGDSTRATAETIYRTGPVSQLLTDIAVMQLVERGKLNLDAPVNRYLPDFKPANRFGKPITLRQLLTHRAGLVREPPTGNSYDSTSPALAATTASLNRTRLVNSPGSSRKFSDAGIAVAGDAVAWVSHTPFATYIRRQVLTPIGIPLSGFSLEGRSGNRAGVGTMWTVDGRRFPAPVFPLGVEPAEGLSSSVRDLGVLLSALFAGGRGSQGTILSPRSVSRLWSLSDSGQPRRGEGAGSLDQHPVIEQSGSIYGFAAALEAVPGDKLGVAVFTNLDGAVPVVRRIADAALRAMMAQRQGKAIPEPVMTMPVSAGVVARMPGHFFRGKGTFELREREGALTLVPAGGTPLALRARGDTLVVDDVREFGAVLLPLDSTHIGYGSTKDAFERRAVPKPRASPQRWQGIIGEYGWDYNILYIYESEGSLHALVNWFFPYGLEEMADSIFRFPPLGLFAGEAMVFHRGPGRKAAEVRISGVTFPRRSVGPEGGNQLKVQTVRPVPDVIREALTATPPVQPAGLRTPDLLELNTLDSTIHYEIRYATSNNFAGTVFYPSAHAFMQRPAAEAVVRASQWLHQQGYGLLIHDAYRPWYVTKAFWDAMPEAQRWMVANPNPGSKHNRGCAVDLTLYDLKTGHPIEMTGTYDESTDRSLSDYPGGTSLERWHRELLRTALEAQGFAVNPEEWWHFDYQDWRQYPVMNLRFDQLGGR